MRNATLALTAAISAGLLVLGTSRLAQANDTPQPEPPPTTQPTPAQQAGQGLSIKGVRTEPEVCTTPAESYAGKTIAQWRAEGPEGLAKLLEELKPTIERHQQAQLALALTGKPAPISTEDQANLLLLDHVAQQRDALTSRLYWFTDLDEAIAQAKRTDKPILSLRMLGKLVDEYSCANSRFFRTVLYADQTLGELLREKFVLHWESVRPVPVITIDMGDGRQIKRTITGNSAHYVLDTNGRVVECLPGLYGPDTFERLTKEAYGFARAASDVDEKTFVRAVKMYHLMQAQKMDQVWAELVKADDLPADAPQLKRAEPEERAEPPNAREAGNVAPSKAIVEMPLVRLVLNDRPTPDQVKDDAELWDRVAQHYAKESRLDPGSRAILARKLPPAERAASIAFGKARVETPLLRVVRNFENSIALDTARNEHLLHSALHDWFIEAEAPLELAALNKRVYAELFLTPDEDPWLGLVPAGTYTALDNGGLVQ